MVTLLVGASGLLGNALQSKVDDQVRQLVRRPPHPGDPVETVQWDPSRPPPPSVFSDVTTVINLGGAGVGDRRWTKRRLETIRTSRTIPTHSLALGISHLPHKVHYLQASAVGFYGDTGETKTSEEGGLGETVLADICRAWEASAQPAIDAGHPTAFLRTGIVLSPEGGALSPLLKLLKVGLGGPLGSGEQWWPWIHVEDWVGATRHVLTHVLTGPINMSSPNPASNKTLTQEIATAMNRPSYVPAPRLGIKLLLGGFADEILRDQRVVPERLLRTGYDFLYPSIAQAAQALVR